MTTQELQSVKNRFAIIGNSPHLNYAIQVAVQVAPTDMTVMISGESGSGKESFSKIIHALSARKHGQFIAINCGAIPEGTIDSELFGHEKGSFTGATDARKGYFEVTNGGTIFLDEIGEMPLGTQARLLRVLENGEFIRVGSSKVQKTDVRVVAATNVNLLDAVARGRFREDLYYRLNSVPIAVPPLRERGQDIELLFRKFATDFAERYHVRPIRLLADAVQLLIAYGWPGNIRQLKNIAEQVSILESERDVAGPALRRYLPEAGRQLPALIPGLSSGGHGGEQTLSERELLYKVLFDMRRDVTELKSMVLELAAGDEAVGRTVAERHQHIFAEREPQPAQANAYKHPDVADAQQQHTQGQSQGQPLLLAAPQREQQSQAHCQGKGLDQNADFAPTQDIDHAIEEESLSLERKEKELIIKALSRNANRRKNAAKDLGISERTLYRKIKQYGMEES